ncbi:MAG: glycosyltransferase [Acidobacteria bacterium]|nr:glycosyltransferase [Acidobacteriota bacterium]
MFLPTASQVEMLGLAAVLYNMPDSRHPSYHLVFRRNIYIGRERDYRTQDLALHDCRRTFHKAEEMITDLRQFHYYTDTDELSAQYNRLLPGRFRTLSIPHTWRSSPARRVSKFRLVYAGDGRKEKGYQHLHHLAQELYRERIDLQLEFVIQTNYNTPDGEPECIVAQSQLSTITPGITLLREPLASAEYRKLVQSADAVLLLYDRDNYYARSSGILVEALSLGIPVVAPTGTWLTRQFLAPVYRHYQDAFAEDTVLARMGGNSLRWRDFRHVSKDSGEAEARLNGKSHCRLKVPNGATHLRIRIEALTAELAEARLFLNMLDESGRAVEPLRELVAETARDSGLAVVLRPIGFGVECIVLTFEGYPSLAFRRANLTIDFLLLSPDMPLGAVGAIYHDESEVGSAVRELMAHREHYRRTAEEFAVEFRNYHSSDRLIADLINSTRGLPQ